MTVSVKRECVDLNKMHMSVFLQGDEKRKQEKADKIRREWERRMNPNSKTDFDLLYAALESKWIKLVSYYSHRVPGVIKVETAGTTVAGTFQKQLSCKHIL